VVAVSLVFYQSRNEMLAVQNRTLMGMVIEPKAGTYALILSCAGNERIQIGRLGAMQLQRGYYIYVGSALGPGGLRGRIAHHQKPSTRPHWHIDYLRPHSRFHGLWLSYGAQRREHQWARVVEAMSDAKIPLLGFGASDCDCRSHLYFFKRCPSRIGLQKGLESLVKRHPPVEDFQPERKRDLCAAWLRHLPATLHNSLDSRPGIP
jgi:Uri superfamily endonuclease